MALAQVVPSGPSSDALAAFAAYEFLFRTSPTAYRLCWFGFLLFHGTCGAYYIFSALMYEFLPQTVLSFNLEALSIGLGRDSYRVMSWINWFFTVMHSLAAIKMIIVSLRFRSFLYEIPDESVPKSLRAAPTSTHSPSKHRRVLQRPVQVLHLLFGHQGLFGIQGKHYVTIFVLKESVQMVLRSHQASKLSAVVACPALVRSFVALVTLQCCSTPFIHRRFGHAGGQERMCYVFCDVFMCFTTTIVIPTVLAIPYVNQYDPQTRNFPIHSHQNSVWFSVMVTKLQRIHVASWVDVITRIFMSVSILASLSDAKLLLARSKRCLLPQPGQVSPPKRSKSITHSPSFRTSFLRRQNSSVRRAKQSLEQVLHVVIFLFGVAVFIVHLRAELHGHETSCVLPVRPWLSAKAGCSLFVTSRVLFSKMVWSMFLTSCPSANHRVDS